MNVFDKYIPTETKHAIKALDGAEVTLRKLTLKESTDLTNKLVKSVDKHGVPEMDMEAAGRSKLEKLSLAMVDPKMTVDELLALGTDASTAIDEIYAIVDPKTAEAIKKAEGKQN